MKVVLLSVCALLVFTMDVFAGGYQLNLFGIRQVGMAHVGTPMADDAANMAFNPGAIGFLSKNEIIGGSSLTFINTGYQAPAPSTYEASTEARVNFPFNAHGVWRHENSGFGAGVSVYTPYGSSVVWPEGWKNQFLLQEISLQSVYVQPTVGYQVNDFIAIGAGLVYGYGMVNLQRSLPIANTDGNYGRVELDGSTSAIGYNLGVMINPAHNITIGAGYRSGLDMDVEGGDADFRVASSLEANFPQNNQFDASLPLPAVFTMGVAVDVTQQLRIAGQADFTEWSAYEELAFDFTENTPQLEDSREPRDYEDTWIFRLATEYQLNDRMQLRAGTYYDMSPVQDGYMTPETPDSDRVSVAAGFSSELTEQLSVNLSLIHIRSQEREQTETDLEQAGTTGMMPVGTFQTYAWIPGISFSFSY